MLFLKLGGFNQPGFFFSLVGRGKFSGSVVDGKNPATVEVGNLSQYLQFFFTSQVVVCVFFHQQQPLNILVFQPAFFRGELLVSGRVLVDDKLPLSLNKAVYFFWGGTIFLPVGSIGSGDECGPPKSKVVNQHTFGI